jgi:hypothetical protein
MFKNWPIPCNNNIQGLKKDLFEGRVSAEKYICHAPFTVSFYRVTPEALLLQAWQRNIS